MAALIEALVAGSVLALCAVLLARLLLPAARRQRFDAACRRAWGQAQRVLRRPGSWRRQRRDARREADAAIRRAQHRAQRDGNVVRPEAFKRGPREPS